MHRSVIGKKDREKAKNYTPRSKRARSYYQQSKRQGYDNLDAKAYARNMVRSQNTALAVLGASVTAAVAYGKYSKKARQAVSRTLNTKVKRGVVAGAVAALAGLGLGALVEGSREATNKSFAYSAQQDILKNYEKANPGSTKTPQGRQAILDKHYGYR